MPVETPSRSLPLAGATNFRDLGGYTGQDGRQVAWRRIFRSDHLAALTPDDQARLAALGIARTVDFRGERERAQLAYLLPAVEHHQLAIEPTVVQRAIELQREGRALTAQDAVALMQETYRGFVHENAPRFAEFFCILLAKDTPLVFHCHHGIRSQSAGEYCIREGFTNVSNVVGGIDAWSREIDPAVPTY